MHKVFIVTNSYPYAVGEDFFYPELECWAKRADCIVTLLPLKKGGQARLVPQGVRVDTALAVTHKRDRYFYTLLALFSSFFWSELLFLWRRQGVTSQSIRSLLITVGSFLRIKSRLKSVICSEKKAFIIYAYWSDVAAYAACFLKRENPFIKIVARAHGYDLYEERRVANYMPLKRRFAPSFDALFVLSNGAKKYAVERYGFHGANVHVSPLGVTLPASSAPAPKPDHPVILTLSYCVELKRIEKVVDALEIWAKKNNKGTLRWVHIGDGPLYEFLKRYAEEKLGNIQNVSYDFAGRFSAGEVQKFLQASEVSLILNVSDSEGMPVSLMEAMSVGIPPIAPNVGEISDLVSPYNGWLLGQKPSPLEIADAIERILTAEDYLGLRINAREKIEGYFLAEKNFCRHISSIVSMVDIE